MRKKVFAYLLFAVCYLVLPQAVFSAGNFLNNYNVIYTVYENGATHASFNINLTNTSSQYYASSYTLNLGFENISNIKASDPDGEIVPVVSKTTDGQKIDLTFNKRVVGTGSNLTFNLSFDTLEVAKKQGNIWEINIPGLSNQNEFQSFNVEVKAPLSFGKPVYIKPQQKNDSLVFTKEHLGKSGVSVAFGQEQIYSFSLLYHLNNTHVFPIKTEIAIPPSTNYQDIFIENINPKPLNVRKDKDGNWLAQFYLLPSQKIDVKVMGKAQINLFPKKQKLSEIELMDYLEEKPYWQTENPKIKKLAKELATPPAIYEYVVRNLTYDFSRVSKNLPRLGAQAILDNPSSAVCLEFTDLFITLARAAGIPAREVNGFAYTQNSKQRPLSLVRDVLHAWPEYYDKELETWIMIDPTWEATTLGIDYFNTLDFDHFAFVIKGEDSRYPVPPGGYKDIEVGFAGNFEKTTAKAEIKENLNEDIFSGLPIQGSLTIANIGSAVYPSQTATIKSDGLTPKIQKITIGEIPPFGFLTVPFSFEKTPLLTNKKATVTIWVADQTISKTVKIAPVFLNAWSLLGGVLLAFSIVFLFVFTKRTWYLSFFRQKQSSPVYREGKKP